MLAMPSWAAHGYALWDDLKYPAGFPAFGYVDPAAPKGGELRLVSNQRYSTFDKYNPFTIKGSPPAYLATLMFDTLLAGSMDETSSGYGLLAEDVEVAPDRLSATFRLRPEARFHNGMPVEAADVKHSYETLIGPYAMPSYKSMLEDVAGVDVVDARTVRFRFRKPNRELPLTVGSVPVFSRAWGVVNGKAKRFDEVVTDFPIGSGPYKIGPVRFGKDITYVRDPGYWARDLNVRRGSANFDRITVKIYRDNTARLEALKAAEFDLMTFYSAGDWARRVTGKRFDSGELVKAEFPHRQPAGFQSYVLNSRKPFLADRRVREALGLAVDYEFMNRQLFYNGYPRVVDLFGNTDCAATGDPSPEEAALLQPWRGKVPDAVFGPMYQPPKTEGPACRCGPTCAGPRPCSRRPAGNTAMGPCAMRRARPWCWTTWTAATPACVPSPPGCATWKSWASCCASRRSISRSTSSGWTSSSSTSPASTSPAPTTRASSWRTSSAARRRTWKTQATTSASRARRSMPWWRPSSAPAPRPNCCRPAGRWTGW